MRRQLLHMLVVVAFAAPPAHAEVVVGSFDPSGTARIFADAAQGDVAPVRTIGGPQTQLQNATSFAFDGSRADIYVGDFNGQAIRVFDARQTGDRPATRTITSGGLGQVREIALDTVHDELFAITLLSFVSTYPRGANGPTSSVRRIDWAGLPGSQTRIDNPSGLVYLPAQDQLAVGDFQQSGIDPAIGEILFFARTANGGGPPARALRGALTQLGNYIESLAFDRARNELYALAVVQGAPDVHRIVVFGGDAAGDVAPLRVIEGPATLISGQSTLGYDAKSERIWVATNGDRLVAFPRLATGDAT
ncbi:MAG TPA: hypothetical protein VFL14_06205, partial [Xanthomonadales bacterium]|nr:hypothetical protein [Xanthomonadales bacterium]